MPSIHFTFTPESTAEERQTALGTLRAWPGVMSASLLKPGAKHPLTARIAYAMVDDQAAEIDELMSRIRALPGIESVSVPPRRGLPRTRS